MVIFYLKLQNKFVSIEQILVLVKYIKGFSIEIALQITRQQTKYLFWYKIKF